LRPLILRRVLIQRPRARRGSLLPGRRVKRRNPLLAAIGDADQALLRLLRTRGHSEPVETAMKALGMAGEYAAIWIATGAVGASIDERRRGQWLAGGAVGPLAIGINLAVKLTIGRERPVIEDHPALARAPTKLSFPSAHATSSVAAATAFGRVEPRARPYLFTLAAAICVGRPYLGMHYPSDVLAGVALGGVVGTLVPGLGRPATEDRLFDLAVDANERARSNGAPVTTARAA
jgi:membrane-associated phospholipid phosphatase